MQFNPLFFPQSSPGEPSKLNFKFSGSTYLFADILRVYSGQGNINQETDQPDSDALSSNNPLTFDIPHSLKLSFPKADILNSGNVTPVDLESIIELVDEMSYPLTEKGFQVSPTEVHNDNSDIDENKKYISSVELDEIVKKIAYLTGAINYNQFLSENDNLTGVIDNIADEVKISTRDILNVLNTNTEVKINLESGNKVLNIELKKIEPQKHFPTLDFVFFNEKNGSYSVFKPSLSSDKDGKEPELKDSLQSGIAKDTKFSKPVSGTIDTEFTSEKDARNQVYEVKLELVSNKHKNEVNGFSEKDKVNIIPYNADLKASNQKGDLNIPSLRNLDKKENKESTLPKAGKNVDVLFNKIKSEYKPDIKNTIPVYEEAEDNVNLSGKIESGRKDIVNENKLVIPKSAKANNSKESEPEQIKNEQNPRVEKPPVLKASNEESNPNDSQGKHQSSLFTSTPEKITEVKTISPGNIFKSINETLKEIPVEKIFEEVIKLTSSAEKNIVLKIVPEHLGKVKVTLNILENTVHANLEVENEAVKNIIQSNSENLKNSLMQQGLQLSSLNISLSGNEQKTGKSLSSKRKTDSQSSVNEIDDKENKKIYKNYGYNTYEYLA